MPIASIVVPCYNATATLPATLASLLAQSFIDYEIIVVDDGSTDETRACAASFGDDRIKIVSQANRGLAGARNTGIAAARGRFIGFCDADDLWHPEKLGVHVAHLAGHGQVGVSYSASALIDAQGAHTGHRMVPRLSGVDAAHIFKRNPIGNGSAPVIRAEALNDIAYRPDGETERDWYFDETYRQSEDIECWLRIALTTDWHFEGVRGDLTLYRINPDGLSAATDRQYASWERMVEKLRPVSPSFFDAHEAAARSYQLRYLARRAISSRDGAAALRLAGAGLRTSLRPLREEPMKTVVTVAAALALKIAGAEMLDRAEFLFHGRRAS